MSSTIWQDPGFDVNTVLHFSVVVTQNDAAMDASTVTFEIKEPDGTRSNPTVSHDGTGHYSADFEVTQAGQHFIRWESVSPTVASEESFLVRYSVFD